MHLPHKSILHSSLEDHQVLLLVMAILIMLLELWKARAL
jgi:hypothetical protein